MSKFLDYTGLQRVISNLQGKFNSYVPVTRKINGKALTSDITIETSGGVTMEEVDAAIQAAVLDSWSSEI